MEPQWQATCLVRHPKVLGRQGVIDVVPFFYVGASSEVWCIGMLKSILSNPGVRVCACARVCVSVPESAKWMTIQHARAAAAGEGSIEPSAAPIVTIGLNELVACSSNTQHISCGQYEPPWLKCCGISWCGSAPK